MYVCPFRPITDKIHFPVLASGSGRIVELLMGCENLAFMALEDPKRTRMIVPSDGALWHTYGDTRWPAVSTCVEFPMPPGCFAGHAGVLVVSRTVPTEEPDTLAWIADNNPLLDILPELRGLTSIEERYALLQTQSEILDDQDGPTDATPRYVQGYCIFHCHNQSTPVFVSTYLDVLNAEGLPIHKYRTAGVNKDDIPLCQFTLHSLFSLNRARIAGTPFIEVNQLKTFTPEFRTPGLLPPHWSQFHPLRVLRLRPNLRALPSPTLCQGTIMFDDFEHANEVRGREANAHMLCFASSARPRDIAIYQNDSNISMMAFTHRANGGAIYILPDRLVEEFDNTECGEVHIGDITLPFPSCYFSFTPPEPVSLSPGTVVDGCYLNRQSDEYLVMLTTRLVNVDYERSLSLVCLDPTFSIRLPATDPDLSINDAIEKGIAHFLADNAPPPEDLTQTIERPDGTTCTMVDVRVQNRHRRIEQFRAQELAFRKCLNILVNAACFISFRPEDIYDTWAGNPPTELIAAIEDPGKTRAARARKRDAVRVLDTADYVRIKICGKALFTEPTTGEIPGTGKSPRAHWRRGHWRRQRHGPSLSLFQMRWIRPTLVCKDIGSIVDARVYDVQDSETQTCEQGN